MQNYMKTIISALQTWINKRIKSNTPDWNQNDSESDGYIKNKPFYTDGESVIKLDEKYIPDTIARTPDWNQNDETANDYIKNRPFYTGELVETEIFATTITSYQNYSNGTGITQLALDSEIVLTEGKTYKVLWNGVEYEVVAWNLQGTLGIGDKSSIDGSTSTGEPFLIGLANTMCMIVAFDLTSEMDARIVSIREFAQEIVKIPEKYLPPQTYVSYASEQGLTSAQMATARENIGAGTSSFDGDYHSLTNQPDLDKYLAAESKTASGTFSFTQDKVTTGRDTITVNGWKYYKISDMAIPRNECVRCDGVFTVVTPSSTSNQNKSATYSNFNLGTNCYEPITGVIIVESVSNGQCVLPITSTSNVKFSAPSAGIYAMYNVQSNGYSRWCQSLQLVYQSEMKYLNSLAVDSDSGIYEIGINDSGAVFTKDEDGNVTTMSTFSGSYNDLSEAPVIDTTLSVEGAPADAKAVGDALAETGVWYVHATANDDGSFTLDKTYDDIIAAYNAGRKVQCEMRYEANPDEGAYIFDLIAFGPYVPDVYDGDTVYNGALFVLWMQNRMMRMLVTTDNQVMMFQTNRFQTEGELQIRYGNELMYAGHMGVDVDIDLNIPINAPKDYVAFTDQVNGYIYYVSMRNGTLVSTCAIETIEVASMPTTVEYTAGDAFDPSGLTIMTTRYDGTTAEVTDFTYDAPETLTEDVTAIPVTYTDMGVTYTVDVPITVNPFDPEVILVDFDYTNNGDGTYTITGWKGTNNGEASTEMIIPNYSCIIV